ncbi:MAG: hypothetical protein AAGF71_02660 [Pseudomonadota bacterium]
MLDRQADLLEACAAVVSLEDATSEAPAVIAKLETVGPVLRLCPARHGQ